MKIEVLHIFVLENIFAYKKIVKPRFHKKQEHILKPLGNKIKTKGLR